MTNVLHRPQPLPIARLGFGVELGVVVLHLGLLWMAHLNWPPHTALSGAAHNTQPSVGGQIFTEAGNRVTAGSYSNHQVISNAGRQRFGRAEVMLSLENGQPNDQPISSMPRVKAAGITTVAKTNADAPVNLILTPFYLVRPREAFAANLKTANDIDCAKKMTEVPSQGLEAAGPLLKRAREEKCRNSK